MAGTLRLSNTGTGNGQSTITTAASGDTTYTLPSGGGTFVTTGSTQALTVPFASGTASAPSISFLGDSNTGIYSPGADQVAISTNGTGQLRVASNGDVYVNSGAVFLPNNQRLHWRNAVNSGWAAGIQLGGDDNLYINDNSLSNAVIVRGGSGERLRITSAGLVGVGTSSPGQLLEIASASNPQMRFTDTGDYYYDIGITSSNKFSISPAGTPALTVVAAGNVGVGTTSPGENLSIAGGANLYASLTSTGGVKTALSSLDGSSIGWAGTVSNHGFALFANNTERARIDSSGRLLVGTSSAITTILDSPKLQVFVGDQGVASFTRGSNNEFGPNLHFVKSRNTSPGSRTIVQSGDELGSIFFIGDDGSDLNQTAARIFCAVDGTPGTDDMPGRLVFSTTADGASSPMERMRITQDGNINIGSGGLNVDAATGTADGATFYAASGLSISRNNANVISVRRRAGDGNVMAFYRDTTAVGTISVTTTATAYNTSSDYRLKENVVAVTDGITRLQQLKPSRFNFIADPDKTVDGFLAHEAAEVVPECVTGEKDAVDDDGNPVYQGIDQSKLVPLLTAALQEAIGEIESLKARVAALEAQ